MHGRAAGTLQEVIYARYYKQLVAMLLQMQQTLVGVDYLLKVNLLLYHMNK